MDEKTTELSVRPRHGGDSAGCNHCLVLRIVTDQEPTTPRVRVLVQPALGIRLSPSAGNHFQDVPQVGPVAPNASAQKIPPASDRGGRHLHNRVPPEFRLYHLDGDYLDVKPENWSSFSAPGAA